LIQQERAKEQARVVDLIEACHQSAEDAGFLAEATVLAHELPRRVREVLNEFRLQEPSSALCRISGYPIDDEQIGPTPSHWKERQKRCRVVREEILLVLLGSLLGDVIAWATQQDSAVVHDIVPIPGHEKEQLGSGSAEELTWHTEDAFHPFRGDYLGMMYLRNDARVPTTFAALDISALDERTLALLFEPYYTIRPDNSHRRKNRVAPIDSKSVLETAHDRIEEMVDRAGEDSYPLR
jgi:Fe(II)/alpha-ketoglutarate-dependent arginine beta-hydroxylase